MATIDDILKLVATSKPDTLRIMHNALKKYSLLFQSNDAVYLFNNLEEVKNRFLTNLAEHSVRHYIGVLAEAAHIDEVASLVFTTPSDGIAAVDVVLATCSALTTKVPRKPRTNTDAMIVQRGAGSIVDSDDDTAISNAQSVSADLLNEVADMRVMVAKLEVQVAGLKDRLDDSRYIITKLFEAAAKHD